MDGEKVRFTTVVVGSPVLNVQWLHNSKPVQQNPDFLVEFNPQTGVTSLEITDVFPQDTGMYECVASNEFGRASVSTHLTVEGRFGSSTC